MKNIEVLIKEYDDFRNLLKDDLKNKNEINQQHCYLIDENWINSLENCIDKFYNSNNNFYFPSQNPKLINSFSELIDFMQKDQHFDLINHSLIDYKYRNLKRSEVIYLAQNNKIIIDFNENNSLLIVDPFNKNQIRNNSYVILDPNIYEDLLSIRCNFNIIIKNKYNKYVIPFEKYIKKKNNSSNYLRRELLKIFIYIFYYEKALNKNKREFLFNNEEQYFYLIEPEWINKYKEYYHYNELYNLLSKENYKMNYNDLDKYINDILDEYIYEDIFDFDLKNNKFFNRNSNKINFSLTTKQYYIMHPKIFGLIQKYESISHKIDLEPKELIIKNNNYLFIDYKDNNIFIGDFNNNLFTSKYVLSYNSDQILESELEYLLSLNSIREYIKNSHCNENESKVQKIIDDEEVIGELRILNIIESNYRKINNIHRVKSINIRNNSNLKPNKNNRRYFSPNKEEKYESKEDINKYNKYNKYFSYQKDKKNEAHYHQLSPQNKNIKLNKAKNFGQIHQIQKDKSEIKKQKLNKEIKVIKDKEDQYDKRVKKEDYKSNKQNEVHKNKMQKQQNQKINLGNGKTDKDLMKNPILSYSNPALVGLNNIGATCFMNSTLQCLSQTKALANFFLNKKHITYSI